MKSTNKRKQPFGSKMKEIPKKKLISKENNINNGNSVNKEEQYQDRLSSLPELLLLQILTLLPLQSVVATSVLSRRWRNLWTQHPFLYLDTSPYIHFTFSKFCRVITQILGKLTSPKIHTFILRYPYAQIEYQIKFWRSNFDSWIPMVCGRNPDEIKVILEVPSTRYPLIALPLCLLETSSLVNLELTGPFYCESPRTCGVCLPKLKKLVVKLVHLDSHLMGRLVKSCPILESLSLELIWGEYGIAMRVLAPNLKHLDVKMSRDAEDCVFWIDTPKLEDVVIHGHFAFYRFVNRPSALMQADIGFCPSIFGGRLDYLHHMWAILQQISSVRTLHLLDNIGVLNSIDYVDVGVLRSFCNLSKICINCVSLDQLNWSCPIPDFLLSKLKVIVVEEIDGDEHDIKLMKYVLEKAEILEELHVKVTYSEGWNDGEDDNEKEEMWKEFNFCKDLFRLSRPPTCEIKLSGEYVHTSTQNIQNGSMLCLLKCFETGKTTYETCVGDFKPL